MSKGSSFNKINCLLVLQLVSIVFFATVAIAGDIVPAPENDPHYTKVGFFDIHVCNWPDQPLFFLTLFSSYQYNDVAKVEVYAPKGQAIGELDLTKYRLIQKKGKPDKRAFISYLSIPEGAGDGWYTATVTMKNGSRYAAKDFVILHKMQRPTNIVPADGAEDIALPQKLTWDPIPGAKFYQVFIKDNWEGVTIFESELLSKPELVLPKGKLTAGGYYSWRIHARDVNENVLLGDFNHGSLTNPMTFTVSSDAAAQQ